MQNDRRSEWFVPKFGSKNFRLGVGILFLPYTGMVVSFAAWGSLAGDFDIQRLGAICVLYFLALGISAHCLDALGSKKKPWGFLPKKKIWTIAMMSLAAAFTIGLYYAFLDSPLLLPIGIAESFFLFAYNLELFGGRFHNNLSFAISWGVLPVLAGAAIQTNSISVEALALSVLAGLISYLLITTSRRYKQQKRQLDEYSVLYKNEIILKVISLGVIVGTIFFLVIRHLYLS